MKLYPGPVPLMPLRGPLGSRQVFCSGALSPILRPSRPNRDDAIGMLAMFCIPIPGAWMLSCYFETMEVQSMLFSDMFKITILLWISTELVGIGSMIPGFRWKAYRKLERCGRLAELALSPSRPVEIAQFAFYREIQQLRLYALALFSGFLFSIVTFVPALVPFIVPIGFMALNQLRGMQHAMWLELAAFLSSENYIQRLRTLLAGALAYLCWMLPAACLACSFESRTEIREPFLATAVLLAFLAAWVWTVQYLLARAWAARIEQAIFHRIEF